jgi:branched-chain amino acid transport system ATP-binding protein
MNEFFAAQGVSVSFGAVRALSNVDIEVREGQLVGLIGPNGAGKTTFIDAVTGFVPARGAIVLKGANISSKLPHERARLGLARTWQTIELFDDLTVGENLTVASRRNSVMTASKELLLGRTPRSGRLADEALRILELTEDADRLPGELPQGKRKLVGVARALAAEPQLILLDEPASGLDTHESVDLGRRLRRMVDEGISMLLVDHDMGLVLSICDYVYVLDFGQILAAGTPSEIRRNPAVLAAYLGSSTEDVDEDPSQVPGLGDLVENND